MDFNHKEYKHVRIFYSILPHVKVNYIYLFNYTFDHHDDSNMLIANSTSVTEIRKIK